MKRPATREPETTKTAEMTDKWCGMQENVISHHLFEPV